ncbi:MAG: hypothetical protein ACREKE_00500 [bacterium]
MSRHAWALRTGKNPPPIANTVASLFFPQSKSLGLDLGSYSPGLLQKIVYAGSNACSFSQGSQHLLVLAEVCVSTKQVERLTEQIGQERQAQREAATQAWLDRPLMQREDSPPDASVVDLGVVEFDGGRLQIRTWDGQAEAATVSAVAGQEQPNCPTPQQAASSADSSAADSPATGPNRSKHWREDKVGCLLAMTSTVSDVDPCPEVPGVFVDPLAALKLAQEVGHSGVAPGTPFHEAQPQGAAAEEACPQRPGRPEIEKKRVLASRKDIHAFGPLLAAAAVAMGLFGAARRAFVADGSGENWSVYKRYFPRWTAVLDFIHALTYVYKGALAGRTFQEGWPVYERWIGWVWSGQVERVIRELTLRQQEVGQPSKEGSVPQVVQEVLTYLSNHKDKMRYDAYRKAGLPLMSSHVESTIKQMNYRVKGTEKFWSEAGAEAILQLRADYLSDDDPMGQFWQHRQETATGQRRYRRSA